MEALEVGRPRDLPRAPAARLHHALGARDHGPPGPARPAMGAAHPPAAAAGGGRRDRPVRGHPRRRRPRPPPLRRLPHQRRALRGAGGRGPQRPRHQADRVPHQRRLADRPGADARRRAGQADRLPGGAAGALRRGAQHPVGAGTSSAPASTSSTACRGSRPTRRSRSSSGGRATGCGATSTSATGNYNPSTARLYTDLGLFTCREDLAEDVADLFNHLTGFARRAELPQGAGGARPPARRHPGRDRPRGQGAPPRVALPGRHEDELAHRRPGDRRRSTGPRRRACRST